METFGKVTNTSVRLLLFDVDRTLYPSDEAGEAFIKGRGLTELEQLATLFRWSTELMQRAIARHRAIAADQDRPISRTEAVYRLLQDWQIDAAKWSQRRAEIYCPDGKITIVPEVKVAMEQLAPHYQICFGTTSPPAMAQRVLELTGITEVIPQAKVFGDESFSLEAIKPNPMFFTRISQAFGFTPDQVVSIGDRKNRDIDPALDAGYAGGILITGPAELPQVVELLKRA